jgi:hypothetical protein
MIDTIEKIAKTTKKIESPIHRGERTHNHDQVIVPQSLRAINKIVNAPQNPICIINLPLPMIIPIMMPMIVSVMIVIVMSMYHRWSRRGNVSIMSMVVIGRRFNIRMINNTTTNHKRKHKCYN